jgi:hypothetical protein
MSIQYNFYKPSQDIKTKIFHSFNIYMGCYTYLYNYFFLFISGWAQVWRLSTCWSWEMYSIRDRSSLHFFSYTIEVSYPNPIRTKKRIFGFFTSHSSNYFNSKVSEKLIGNLYMQTNLILNILQI